MLRQLDRLLRSRWEEFGCPGRRPERFLYALSAERHPHSKAVLCCLPQGDGAEALIVKIQKDDLQQPFLRTEYARLKALDGQESLRELRASIPRPLFFGEIAGHPALIETFVPGVPFSKHSRRREPGLFLGVSNWLRAFHSHTLRTSASGPKAEIAGHFLRPLELAKHALRGNRSIQHFLDCIGQKVDALSGTGLPLVFGHNDLTLNNIRFQGNRIGVIDWEFSRSPDLPLLDLINVFLFFAMTWKRLSYTKSFRLAFSEGNDVSGLLRQCIRDYVRDLGLPSALLSPLVVQYLVSRIPLLQRVGNLRNCEEVVWCLHAVAVGDVDLEAWEACGSGS